MKTRVKAIHEGEHTNGVGGCMGRSTNGGRCPGEETAEWLNAIGDDGAPYGGTTAGEVRRKWAAAPYLSHVVLAEPDR